MRTATNFQDAAPLATFRIFFGILMFISLARFWANGWIEKLYIEPVFHFKYYGFSWVQVPTAFGTYFIFMVCALSSIAVAVGFKYRLSIVAFFLSFTYIELMDKTTYLNHYYFISVLSFLLIFLPMHRYFSWDARGKEIRYVPTYATNSIKLLIAIVYVYAGLAKLNPDWLFKAMPLAIWLPSKYAIPFLGDFMDQKWLAYVFSWVGAIYDLLIVFFLLYQSSRKWAYLTVVIFHLLTGVLFPIGMFPYVMIMSALIFFDPPFHHRIINFLRKILGGVEIHNKENRHSGLNWLRPFLVCFFVIQILIPLRFIAYPGNLFWTEQGYRFSWRVMLMEKAGYAQFKVSDEMTGKYFMVDNSDFLTSFQEKQMATQPDFILEYAHFLGNHFSAQGHENIRVHVESFVAFNGRGSRPYIDPKINLLGISDSFKHRNWVLPFDE